MKDAILLTWSEVRLEMLFCCKIKNIILSNLKVFFTLSLSSKSPIFFSITSFSSF